MICTLIVDLFRVSHTQTKFDRSREVVKMLTSHPEFVSVICLPFPPQGWTLQFRRSESKGHRIPVFEVSLVIMQYWLIVVFYDRKTEQNYAYLGWLCIMNLWNLCSLKRVFYDPQHPPPIFYQKTSWDFHTSRSLSSSRQWFLVKVERGIERTGGNKFLHTDICRNRALSREGRLEGLK